MNAIYVVYAHYEERDEPWGEFCVNTPVCAFKTLNEAKAYADAYTEIDDGEDFLVFVNCGIRKVPFAG